MHDLNFVLNAANLVCWFGCFWWMFRISRRQDKLLGEMHGVMRSVEKLSKAEHDLIKDVHPKVAKIEEHVEEVVEETRARR